VTPAGERILDKIRREGPIAFDAFMEEALYGAYGFFTHGHGAGRRGGDFVTSPEVGSLFGALVARALDEQWDALGAPDPFVVVDAGAGRGRLAADVLAAAPRCAPALRYVLVERSEALRAAQRDLVVLEPAEDALGPAVPEPDGAWAPVGGLGPIAASLAQLPAVEVTGVVVANELLDNLPFRVVERATDGWQEVRVGASDDTLMEELVPASADLTKLAESVAFDAVPVGARVPVPTGVRAWLDASAAVVRRGVLVVVDYLEPASELVARGPDGWLRTFRAHERGTSPLDDPGEQDITADVPLEYVRHAAATLGFTLLRETTQREWLVGLGLDDLVNEARAEWDRRAHVGDLEAVKHRSRVTEAAALVDPAGLGAHRVLVFSTR
jgi:NADH dehydrogenase [ubiquinone] 1 alpha subcomplex assembly factor 7